MYMFEIDIFEFFEKKGVIVNKNMDKPVASYKQHEIDDNIKELEKSLEELKDITKY
tara:strand:- start:877 stop:1044 length:168 start_codon:yes stop_codon:yes gene_type:complete